MKPEMFPEVLRIVRDTRKELIPMFGSVEAIQQKTDNLHSVVTELDIKIEDYLRSSLAKLDRSIGFVGEERGGDRAKERFWLCDPIDGTAHFMRGNEYCTVMLALIEADEVTFGVIYDFVKDVMYYARKGGGAFAGRNPIAVSNRPVTNMHIMFETNMLVQKNCDRYLTLKKRNVGVLQTMTSGHEHAKVACGKAEARICFDPHGYDYDYAAGALIVKEAGGIVANIGKETYDWKNLNFIAASPIAYAYLTQGEDAIFPLK